jgi:hypothetical protein
MVSLDEKHSEMLVRFRENETQDVPALASEIRELVLRAKTLGRAQIEEYMEIRDRVEALKAQIRALRKAKKTYLLDNSRHIFDYFEHKKEISDGGGKQNVNAVNAFFKVREVSPEPGERPGQSAISAYQSYWRNVSNDITNIQDFVVSTDECASCRVGEMVPQDEDGILICNNRACGAFVPYITDSAKPTNKEPPNEVSYTAYIRLNHFKEILSQFQAKETTQIHEDVVARIRARIKKERITDLRELNYDKMREILRKLGLNKYFEHIQYINSLFGIKPPAMSEDLHKTLCVLFIEIQKPWAVHCPPHRTNFFNYTYTLYQLCALLGQTQYLPYISQLKDLEKQREQDQIWKKVCNDLGWHFLPTV